MNRQIDGRKAVKTQLHHPPGFGVISAGRWLIRPMTVQVSLFRTRLA